MATGTMFSTESALQSPAWAAAQQRMGKRTWQLSGPGWRAVVIEERRRVGSYLYAPYGPVCRTTSALDDALGAMCALARTHRAWWVRVEPQPFERPADWGEIGAWQAALSQRGFAAAPHDHQPKHTRLIDLTRGPDGILAGATGSIRTIHRNHGKKGLEVRASRDPADVAVLAGFVANTGQRQGILPRSEAYLRDVAEALMPAGAATLYMTTKDDTPLCATLVYDSPTQRLFAHAGMPLEHRALRPNQPLVTRALIDAHDAGLQTADLFGIAPPDEPEHPWAGFTSFKRSFGGEDVTHLGTWECDTLPLAKAARAARAVTERRTGGVGSGGRSLA